MQAKVSAVFAAALVLGTLLLPTIVEALPFGANSGVTELTPKTLNAFLNTHKPVFIVFYAPWCGHCKAIHPEWEKFAKSVKDVVRVGAVNADQYKELGSQFGIQGFPTIKFWKMGSKKGMKPSDYQQARTAGALQAAALAEINAKGVVTVGDSAAVLAALKKGSSGKAALLFSSKTKSPPMFSVMSQSSHFVGKMPFMLATSAAKSLAADLGVTKFPTVLVLSVDEANERGFTTETYLGAIEYTAMAKHLHAALGGSDAGASSDAPGSEIPTEEPKAKKPAPEPVKPKAAHPVRPVPLVPTMFSAYCGQGSLKIRGQQPLCMISFSKDVSLDHLFQRYGNEPFLFFDAASGVASASEHTRKELTDQLKLGAALKEGDAILIRAFQAGACKYAVVPDATTESLDGALQKAVGGELSLKKAEKFVSLTAPAEEES